MAPREVSGLVLAAGDGERMGGSKALLVVEGDALVRVHARALRDAGCATIVAVVRPEVARHLQVDLDLDLDRDRDGDPDLDLELDHDPDGRRWLQYVSSRAADQAGSLAMGLAALAHRADMILLITPVDAAPARAETVLRLIAAIDAGAEAATPRYRGKGGHPVACRARALLAYASAPEAPPPLRDVLLALGDNRVRVDVDDPRVVVDLDTPADVVAFTGAPVAFLPTTGAR